MRTAHQNPPPAPRNPGRPLRAEHVRGVRPGRRDGGPFPSDRFTVADSSQLTGRRVNLPLPDRATHPSDYDDISVINTLDGFNLQPRLSIPFSGPIDLTTVNSSTVFLIKLDDPTAPEEGGGQVVGINQTVWDVATNTLHVESDELLEQHTRYALIVTRGVRDADGLPVEPSERVRALPARPQLRDRRTTPPCRSTGRTCSTPCRPPAGAGVAREGRRGSERLHHDEHHRRSWRRSATRSTRPRPRRPTSTSGRAATRTVFRLDAVTGITFNRQTRVDPGRSAPSRCPSQLPERDPGGGGHESRSGSTSRRITRSTRASTFRRSGPAPAPRPSSGTNEIYFNLFLPSGPAPAGGWPVAIYGHGTNGNKNE